MMKKMLSFAAVALFSLAVTVVIYLPESIIQLPSSVLMSFILSLVVALILSTILSGIPK